MIGYISIREAAEAAGIDKRAMRARLQQIHAQIGNVLFTFSEAPNAKQWTTPAALKRHMPERFAEVTELDLLEIRQQLSELRARQNKVERMLARRR